MINTIQYYPPHIADIEEFKRIAKVYDKKLQLIWDNIDQMQTNRRFDEMDEAECSRWETMLNIRMTGEEALGDRRRNIKGIWTSGLPYTAKKFKEVLDAMIGADYYKLDINPKGKTMKVSLMLEVIAKDDYIYNLMRAMAPADMVVTVEVIFNRYRNFRTYTYGDLSKYTYEQLRTSTIFRPKFNTYAYLSKFRYRELSSYMYGALMNGELPER